MLPPVFQTLKASADVRTLLGSDFARRISRFGESPQRAQSEAQASYITWLVISGTPELNLSDPPPVDRQSVQVDCWSTTDAGAESLGDAVRAALELVTHVTQYQNFPRDPDTRMFRISIDADFWGR